MKCFQGAEYLKKENNMLSTPDDTVSENPEKSDDLDEPVAIGGEKTEQKPSQDLGELSFEERLRTLEEVVCRNPQNREIHYKTLKYLDEFRVLPDVEGFIQACPEFSSATQSPYFLLLFLIKGGGIDCFELDCNGAIIHEGQKAGLDEDQLDDLIAQFAYQSNEVGRTFVNSFSPENRLHKLLQESPDYHDTYLEILQFLTEKQSMANIDTLLRGRDVLMANREPDDRPVQPSVFIDKLEKVGAIYWDSGWTTSPELHDFLALNA
jgi:hypothetical protein